METIVNFYTSRGNYVNFDMPSGNYVMNVQIALK